MEAPRMDDQSLCRDSPNEKETEIRSPVSFWFACFRNVLRKIRPRHSALPGLCAFNPIWLTDRVRLLSGEGQDRFPVFRFHVYFGTIRPGETIRRDDHLKVILIRFQGH